MKKEGLTHDAAKVEVPPQKKKRTPPRKLRRSLLPFRHPLMHKPPHTPAHSPTTQLSQVLNEADIVCTTLSCAGYNMFSSLKYGFDTVLVDEAAQAVEMSSLIPLRYACRRLILVGDPKQLPATVFSEMATGHNYEQSLFQRLQKGGQQVALLTTQYRMNPAISRFPAATFYHGALRDAPQLARAPPQPWHERRVLAPYVVFDVADGRAHEAHSSW
jgi:senataxin